MEKRKRNAKKVGEEKRAYLYETVLVGCPTCLTRFRARGLADLLGTIVRCPVCGQMVRIGTRNSRILKMEEKDEIEG